MKKVRKLTIILTIVLLCLISFIGIYVEKQNIMANVVKDYDLGMNLKGYREVRMQVAEKEEVTSEKVQQVKTLVEKRLKKLGSQDYLIKADYVTGEIVLELEETSKTDKIVGDVYTAGVLKMVDSEDHSKVFMTNEDIEKVSVVYSTTESGTGIYLSMEFTEEGAKIIEELSGNEYKTIETEESEEETEEETTEEGEAEESEEEVTQPKLTLLIDDSELVSSSFDFPVTTGSLQLSLGTSTDTERIQELVSSGNAIASVLNNGPLPIKYELSSNTYIYSELTEQIKIGFAIIVVVLIAIAFISLIIRYKMSALLALISYIGFIALYLLVLRYANVVISMEGIAGILLTLIINYLITQRILANASIKEAFKEIGTQSIPVIIAIVVFCFTRWTNISSLGMTMFWGLIVTVIYNLIMTKALLEK